MSTRHPSLNRPYADYGDFVDFVNLQGGYEAFNLSESVGVKPSGDEDVWYGREIAGREWEVLYRTSERRWVLVFVIPPGHEDDEGPQPLEPRIDPDSSGSLAPPQQTRSARRVEACRRQ